MEQMSVFYVFMFLLGSFRVGICSSLHFVIDPHNYDGVTTKTVTISCSPGVGEDVTNDVLLLQIFDKGNKLLASVSKNGNVSFTDKAVRGLQIKGKIDATNANKSFLHLTLLKPNALDSGRYSCLMYYKDATSLLKDTRAYRFLNVNDVSVTLRNLIDTVSRLEQAVGTRVRLTRASISKVENNYKVQKTLLKKMVDKGTYISAFSATIDKTIPFVVGQAVKFQKVIMQTGGRGYDKSTSVFTVPRSGVYLFYLTVGNAGAKQLLIFLLTVNNRVVAHTDTGSVKKFWRDANSVSSVIEVKAGDKVKVVMAKGGAGYVRGGDGLSIFGGHCVRAY